MVCVIQIASRIRTELVLSWSCLQAVYKPVWHIPFLCVQWKTPDDGQKNCPKRVQFYSKNKFEKLVHLFGFIIRTYHDARSAERQIANSDCTIVRAWKYISLHPTWRWQDWKVVNDYLCANESAQWWFSEQDHHSWWELGASLWPRNKKPVT